MNAADAAAMVAVLNGAADRVGTSMWRGGTDLAQALAYATADMGLTDGAAEAAYAALRGHVGAEPLAWADGHDPQQVAAGLRATAAGVGR